MRGEQRSETQHSVASRTGYLPGLDGLRAISVAAVLLYHAELPWMRGGYLGVEVFFVISGYLITLLLTTEQERTRSISLWSFWARRARRLLPALYAVLAAGSIVVLAAYRDEAANLAGQVWSALGYVTNWYFVFSNQSYFAAIERPPVFQHLWSLAIEEQFYLVWPLIVLVLGRRYGRDHHAKAIWIFSTAFMSLIWMSVLAEPTVDPSRVYYGTDTRASGLLLGAGLAMLWRPGPGWRSDDRRSVRILEGCGAIGLAALVVCFVRLGEFSSLLYDGGFAIVSVASLLVIMAAVHPRSFVGGRVLGQKAMSWVGLRSYSLYLWHWPIFVFTRPHIDQPLSLYPTAILRLAATVVAAELSYRYVERPIRAGAIGRFLDRTSDRPAALRWGVPGAAVLASVVLVGAVTVTSTSADPPPERAAVTEPVAQVITPPQQAIVAGGPVDPADSTITVLGDSVLLGAQDGLTAVLTGEGLTVDYRARPAWQVGQAAVDIDAEGQPVGRTVIIGLGYNSLWERDRRNYQSWASKLTAEIDSLLTTLRRHGAQHFVWVTLRDPDPWIVPAQGKRQLQLYVWYFMYVNEVLDSVAAATPDLTLADWAAVSNESGLTYDAMHLTDSGIALMAQTILPALDRARALPVTTTTPPTTTAPATTSPPTTLPATTAPATSPLVPPSAAPVTTTAPPGRRTANAATATTTTTARRGEPSSTP